MSLLSGGKAAVFYPAYNDIEVYPNKPKAKKADAKEFKRGADLFLAYHKSTDRYVIDNKRPAPDMAEQFLDALHSAVEDGVTLFGIFCHGYVNGLQFGIRMGRNKNSITPFMNMASILSDVDGPAYVGLYACSTGGDATSVEKSTAPGTGDNSFADSLRDRLCWEGNTYCRIMAHTTAAHSWHNPNVRIFAGGGNPYGGVGAANLFSSSYNKKLFRELLMIDGSKNKSSLTKLELLQLVGYFESRSEVPYLAWDLPMVSEDSVRGMVAALAFIRDDMGCNVSSVKYEKGV